MHQCGEGQVICFKEQTSPASPGAENLCCSSVLVQQWSALLFQVSQQASCLTALYLSGKCGGGALDEQRNGRVTHRFPLLNEGKHEAAGCERGERLSSDVL